MCVHVEIVFLNVKLGLLLLFSVISSLTWEMFKFLLRYCVLELSGPAHFIHLMTVCIT